MGIGPALACLLFVMDAGWDLDFGEQLFQFLFFELCASNFEFRSLIFTSISFILLIGMNFKLKQHQKILFVFSFLFLYLFNPLNTALAATLNSGSEAVIIGVTPSIVNQTKYGCAVSSLKGVLGGTITGVVKVIASDYAVTQCDIARGAIFPNEDGTGYIYNPSEGNPNNSLLGLTMSASQLMITEKPASGVDFIKDKVYALTNFGSVSAQDPSTYYPGAGSDLLRPIQSFWGWSVNFVFSFLILLILAIAFAIIFRQRLGGKADVTIQNSIPNIAMALILVPLSYAISGLFIDAVTIGTNAVHGFLIGPGAPGSQVYQTRNDDGSCVPYNPADITTEACDRGFYVDDDRVNIWNIRGRISIGDEIGNAIGTTIAGGPASGDGALGIILGVFRAIESIIGILTGGSSAEFAWLGSIINFFVSILTLWMSLKIAWILFKKFLTFLLFPIFSPFIFATVALLGNGLSSVVKYSKIMGAASLSFIVTYMMFILTIVFTSEGFQSQFPDIRSGGYIPPLLGLESILDLSSGTDVQAGGITALVLTLVGLGIFFSIPNVLKGIDKALDAEFAIPQFVKDPFVNMKESFDMTFRAAPSFAVDAGRRTLSAGRFLGSTPGRLRGIGAGVRRFRDRAAGYTERDPLSLTSQRRGVFADELSTVEKGIREQTAIANDTTKKPGERSAALTERSRLIDKRDGIIGKAKAEGFENLSGAEAKPPGLKVSFDPAGVMNPPTKTFYDTVLVPSIIPGTKEVFDVGDLVFEGDNVDLPVSNIEIKVFGVKKATDANRSDDKEDVPMRVINRSILDAGGITIGSSKYIPFPTPNVLNGKIKGGEFVIESDQKTFIKEGDTKFKLAVKFWVTDKTVFFNYWGTQPPATQSLNSDFMFFQMTGLGEIVSNSARVKVDIDVSR